MGVVPPYTDISQVYPYFSTKSGIGSVKVTLFTAVSSLSDISGICTYSLEVGKQAIPVPPNRTVVELRISDLGPGIVVMSRSTIEVHAIDSTTSTDSLPNKHQSLFVIHVWVRKRVESECSYFCTRPTPYRGRRVKDARSLFDLAILNNEDCFCEEYQSGTPFAELRSFTFWKGSGKSISYC
jgi:hypothetical protein